MSHIQGFLLAAGISIAISSVVFGVMLRPLQSILSRICSTQTGTGFWVAFTGVMLYLAPLLITLIGFDIDGRSTVLEVVRRAAIGSLAMAIAALLVMARRISRAPIPAATAPSPPPKDPNQFWGDRAAG
jgi:hypothetical protein